MGEEWEVAVGVEAVAAPHGSWACEEMSATAGVRDDDPGGDGCENGRDGGAGMGHPPPPRLQLRCEHDAMPAA